jgi:hypothetical protein
VKFATTVVAVRRIAPQKRKSIFTKENLFFYATGAVGEGEIASLIEALRGY